MPSQGWGQVATVDTDPHAPREDHPAMTTTDTLTADAVVDRLRATRLLTESLAANLAPEDQVVQSMPDVSPTKWHRAHTTWFFETFVLGPYLPGYAPVHAAYDFLFNSYYE